MPLQVYLASKYNLHATEINVVKIISLKESDIIFLQESTLPVYLYNFPANTGALISPELYSKLGKEFDQLKGIKNTFNDLPLSKKFKDALPDRQVKTLSNEIGFPSSQTACLRTYKDTQSDTASFLLWQKHISPTSRKVFGVVDIIYSNCDSIHLTPRIV